MKRHMTNKVPGYQAAAFLFCSAVFVLWEPSELKGKSCPSSFKPKDDFTFNLINGGDVMDQRSTSQGQWRFRAHAGNPHTEAQKSVL